jgi:hypothetical protein
VVAKPVVGSILGMAVLGEYLDCTGAAQVVLVAGVVVVVVATIALARGEAAIMSSKTAERLAKKALRKSGEIPLAKAECSSS